MRKVQFPGPLNVQEDTVIAGDTDEYLQEADQATTQLSRKPKQHSPQHKMQTSHTVSSTKSPRRSRAEREQKKTIGARLNSASAATKRAKAALEKARAKCQEAEASVAAAADTLVNALEAEKQARTECVKEDNETENRMTAAELHEVLRNVLERRGHPEPKPQLEEYQDCVFHEGVGQLLGAKLTDKVGIEEMEYKEHWRRGRPRQDRRFGFV